MGRHLENLASCLKPSPIQNHQKKPGKMFKMPRLASNLPKTMCLVTITYQLSLVQFSAGGSGCWGRGPRPFRDTCMSHSQDYFVTLEGIPWYHLRFPQLCLRSGGLGTAFPVLTFEAGALPSRSQRRRHRTSGVENGPPTIKNVLVLFGCLWAFFWLFWFSLSLFDQASAAPLTWWETGRFPNAQNKATWLAPETINMSPGFYRRSGSRAQRSSRLCCGSRLDTKCLKNRGDISRPWWMFNHKSGFFPSELSRFVDALGAAPKLEFQESQKLKAFGEGLWMPAEWRLFA